MATAPGEPSQYSANGIENIVVVDITDLAHHALSDGNREWKDLINKQGRRNTRGWEVNLDRNQCIDS